MYVFTNCVCTPAHAQSQTYLITPTAFGHTMRISNGVTFEDTHANTQTQLNFIIFYLKTLNIITISDQIIFFLFVNGAIA